jgi:hypothetical protein
MYGKRIKCPNCGSEELEETEMTDDGIPFKIQVCKSCPWWG